MSHPLPTLLPLSESASSSYTSSVSPTLRSHVEQSDIPSRRRLSVPKLATRLPLETGVQPMSSYRLSRLFSPRVLSPIILWTLGLYLVHSYLLPLPLPSIARSAHHTGPSASDVFLSTSFPPSPARAGNDWLDSVNPLYRPLSPLPPPDDPFPRLRPTRFLPPRCLEQWFTEGETLCGSSELGAEETLDATWLWVNGSDTRWRDTMIHWREIEGVYSPEHHFREQNELVHSMRSVLAALPGRVRTFHLAVADYEFSSQDWDLMNDSVITALESNTGNPYITSTKFAAHLERANNDSTLWEKRVSPGLAAHLESTWRIAQTPSWLDFSRRDPSQVDHPFHPLAAHRPPEGRGHRLSAAEMAYPTLRYTIHSEMFHLPSMDRDAVTEDLGERQWKEKHWRQKALPSFNSMAIESRIGWIPGLADVTLALNDDFFLLRQHAVSDFHSPLYGSVIRFDHGYYQQVRPLLDKTRVNDAGEIGGLYHANYVLSQRFPRRLRPYFAHVPKVITRGLHHEASLMFKETLFTSSQRRFRELKLGDGDIQMQWLLTSLRVERWREALLWTYVVTNLGTIGELGMWDETARKELMEMFGLTESDEDVIKIEVHKGERWTLESGRLERVLEQAGWEAPRETEFLFSSMDGHIPPILRPGTSGNANDKCLLDLERCFGSFWSREEAVPSGDMFKRLTFQYPECGDCLITALVTASGPLGLSAFFPSPNTVYTNAPLASTKHYPKYLPPPHLPLAPTWHEADFSLSGVMSTTALPNEQVNLREYTMKLLSRYLYLSGKSVSHFHMLKSPEHAERVFKMIEDNPKVSILGLNDDIEEDYDAVVQIMNKWFSFRWPKKAVWERSWDPDRDRLE